MRPWIIALVLGLVLFGGCVRLTDKDGRVITVGNGEAGLQGVTKESVVQSQFLKAMVKGSVYETGEQVSVFGTCLDMNDDGVVGSYALLSSWYPNGTVFFTNVSMGVVQTGYFVYVGNMSGVSGTYLTEIGCYVNGSSVHARAFGEWQNPVWVRRINETQSQVNVTMQAVNNLSGQTGQWFNITWGQIQSVNASINSTFTNITSQLSYVAAVANASVDRNDSYLAGLLRMIINGSQIPVTGLLNVSVLSVDDPVVNRVWNIEVGVTNEYGVRVGSPVVSCIINVSNEPPTVNQLMAAGSDVGGSLFRWKEAKLRWIGGADFNWSIGCVYN